MLRIGGAAAVMAVVVWAVHKGIFAIVDDSLLARLVLVFVPVGVGAGVYAGVCMLLRIEELEQTAGKLIRRLRRRR